jgi:hypothetical protein
MRLRNAFSMLCKSVYCVIADVLGSGPVDAWHSILRKHLSEHFVKSTRGRRRNPDARERPCVSSTYAGSSDAGLASVRDIAGMRPLEDFLCGISFLAVLCVNRNQDIAAFQLAFILLRFVFGNPEADKCSG